MLAHLRLLLSFLVVQMLAHFYFSISNAFFKKQYEEQIINIISEFSFYIFTSAYAIQALSWEINFNVKLINIEFLDLNEFFGQHCILDKCIKPIFMYFSSIFLVKNIKIREE